MTDVRSALGIGESSYSSTLPSLPANSDAPMTFMQHTHAQLGAQTANIAMQESPSTALAAKSLEAFQSSVEQIGGKISETEQALTDFFIVYLKAVCNGHSFHMEDAFIVRMFERLLTAIDGVLADISQSIASGLNVKAEAGQESSNATHSMMSKLQQFGASEAFEGRERLREGAVLAIGALNSN